MTVTREHERQTDLVSGSRVVGGITDFQRNQLISYTWNDPDIRRFTSDAERFSSLKAFDEWRKKRRKIYVLTNEEDELLGITWFGEEQIPVDYKVDDVDYKEYGITFAVRVYGEARGRGLTNQFMEDTFNLFESRREYQDIQNKGVWLEVSAGNAVAIRAYERFGFRPVDGSDKKGKIIMVRPRGND